MGGWGEPKGPAGEPDQLVGILSPMLTVAEHELIGKLGECWNAYSRIVGDGRTREADCREFVDSIHRCQQAVMSQAAARAYPDMYRLLGCTLSGVPLEVDDGSAS